MPRGPVLPSNDSASLQLASVTTGAVAEVDATSQALRTSEYDAAGHALHAQPLGAYFLPIEIRQTAATVAGSLVWAMTNGSTNTIHIRRIHIVQSFDGTAPAATTLRYSLSRFSGATPTGGTTITPVKKRSSYGASTLADARFLDTLLGVAGITFEGPFAILGLALMELVVAAPLTGGTTAAQCLHEIQFGSPDDTRGAFELASGGGLGIRIATVATVIGSGLMGFVEYEER